MARSSQTFSLFEKILREQTYSTKRVYYHISPEKFSQFRPSSRFRGEGTGGVFLTPNIKMIITFVEDYLLTSVIRDQYYLYTCKLTRDLNIWNPSSKNDLRYFVNKVREDPRAFFKKFATHTKGFVPGPATLKSVIQQLSQTHDWEKIENPAVTDIIAKLGYDGYASRENTIGNIMVFDTSLVKIYGEPKIIKRPVTEELHDEWEQFKRRALGSPIENTRRRADDYEVSDLDIMKEDVLGVTLDDGYGSTIDVTHFLDDAGKFQSAHFRDALNNIEWAKATYDNRTFNLSSDLINYLIDEYGQSEDDDTSIQEVDPNW